MSTRPKRKAATKTTIVELSDSENEATPAKQSKKTRNLDKSFDIASERTAGKRQRWPTKEKTTEAETQEAPPKVAKTRKPRAKKQAAVKAAVELTENQSPNVVAAVEQEANEAQQAQSHEDIDGQCFSRQGHSSRQHNETLPKSTGRNSFWARRKVWTVDELLAETENIEPRAALNIVTLFENENTIPFICRYRRDLVQHMSAERLRDIKNSYTEIVGLRKKAETIVTQLEKENVIDEEVRTEMMCAKSNEELEFLYAPYKAASKGSLAERAKALGLELFADRLLYGEAPAVQPEKIVDYKNPDLDSVEKVLNGICHIISHNISKHTGVLEELRMLQRKHRIMLKSTKSKTSAKEKTTATKEKPTTTKEKKPAANNANQQQHKGNKNDESKYELYFDFQADVRYLKPHQVLAINRGEKSKFLTVKLIINDYLKNDIKSYIYQLFMNEGIRYELRHEIFEKAFEECYSKKLQPLLTRQIRADLNEVAKKAAIDVFAKNLKQLLLMSPLKGERILGIDPGFTNGCKLALISETADVLETGVIYPHSRNTDPEECGEQLAKMLAKHNCKIIALGNGTACRETEFWLSKLYEYCILPKNIVRYSIVSEQGASIYSCSDVAKKEFPKMDVNEISAVSIARRLNDPLSEYVKIEPRHIGVGMYQHDVNEKTLTETLNEVVSECVSYVGVDINTASLSVLKHIAGLTEKKAEKIIQYRQDNGCFRTRKDLLQVKSIGEKTFVQCAGFIRIEPRSVGGQIANLLDCTWVHPESYVIAKKIISKCKLDLSDIGKPNFIAKIRSYAMQADMNELASDFKIPKERLEIVFIALQRELFQDYRADLDKRPLFKQGITRITELSIDDVVTGAVTNITHFGAFVDIGVECDALLHVSKMNNAQLNLGDRITASIIQVDIPRKRIGLRLEEMLLETDTSYTFA